MNEYSKYYNRYHSVGLFKMNSIIRLFCYYLGTLYTDIDHCGSNKKLKTNKSSCNLYIFPSLQYENVHLLMRIKYNMRYTKVTKSKFNYYIIIIYNVIN